MGYPFPMRPISLLSFAVLLAASPAFAQVTVDLSALNALPQRPAPAHPARPASAAVAPRQEATTVTPTAGAPTAAESRQEATAGAPPQAAKPGSAAMTIPPPAEVAKVEMPSGPPPVAEVPPAPAEQVEANAKPPPAPLVSDKSGTTVTQGQTSVTLVFTPDQADLSPDSVTKLQALAAKMTDPQTTTYDVQSFASNPNNDPSTARRLSLSRGMSVRSVLITAGVASPQIFVRALGDKAPIGTPQDRVDVTMTNLQSANSK